MPKNSEKNGTNIPPTNDEMFNFDIELRENVSDHTRQICVTNRSNGEVVFILTIKTTELNATSEDILLYYSTILCEELQEYFDNYI